DREFFAPLGDHTGALTAALRRLRDRDTGGKG
ncbi:hypothetical protein ABIA39_005508, partial [Nocardia sp. GAS34]